MSQMKNMKQMSTTVPNETFDKFNVMYRGCRAVFLRMAIMRAVDDPQFFQDVFFHARTRQLYDELLSSVPTAKGL